MSSMNKFLTTTLMASTLLLSSPLLADGHKKMDDHLFKNVNDFLCKDVMRFSGEHRSIGVAFLHGYVLGKNNQMDFDVDKLSAITDEFTEYCLDNPQSKAVDAMGKFHKK